MSRAQPAAVAPPTLQTDVFDKSKRRDSMREPSSKDSGAESPRGRKYSLTRAPSSRSGSSYSRHDSPDRRPRHRRPRRRSYASSYSRSPSPRQSGRRRSRDVGRDNEHQKPWFKKKSIWATVASLASVASVAAVSMSTQATRESAQATKQSAEATKSSARATRESAAASNRIARETVKSTQAVVNTAVANGHQDHTGRYYGPLPRQGHPRRRLSRDGSSSTRTTTGRGHNLLEYHPIAAKVG